MENWRKMVTFCLAVLLFTAALSAAAIGNAESEEHPSAIIAKLERAESLAQLCHWEYDLSQNTLTFSDSVRTILGLETTTLTNDQFESMLVEDFVEPRRLAHRNLIENGVPYDLEFQVRHAQSGAIRDIHSIGVHDRESGVVFGTFLDITAAKAAERALLFTYKRDLYIGLFLLALQIVVIMALVANIKKRKQVQHSLEDERRRLKTTLLSVGDGVIVTDHYGLIELMNPAAEVITGWTQADACGRMVDRVFQLEDNYFSPFFDVLYSGRGVALPPEAVVCGRNAARCCVDGSAAPILDQEEQITGTVLVFRDVTRARQQQEKITYLSYHDSLTGLYNRRYFSEQLQLLDCEEKWPLSIIMSDVKGLRLVNDAFGHLVGDELLVRVASLLQENCRASDVIARWGGDEFVILLPNTTEHEALAAVKQLEQAFQGEKIASLSVALGFGWATKSQADQDLDEVFKRAEARMYRAKLAEKPAVNDETIRALMSALYERCEREERHSQRVAQLCQSLGRGLGLNTQEQMELTMAGLFHDIGKISIDREILNKPGSLTSEEWAEIRRHPESGYRILNSVSGMGKMAEAVLYHHERWDGSGYPKGLSGEQIPFLARIIAVADAYDAMINARPYRPPLTRGEALAELRSCAGTDFDPEVVEALLRCVEGERVEA